MSETKRIRVYDDRGDFFIDVPLEAELTMQYFNPTRDDVEGAYGRHGRMDGHSAKRTRLSVKVDKLQVAVFLGVNGFRDESQVKLTRLRRKVVVEQKYADDGEGEISFGSNAKRELIVSEEDTYQ